MANIFWDGEREDEAPNVPVDPELSKQIRLAAQKTIGDASASRGSRLKALAEDLTVDDIQYLIDITHAGRLENEIQLGALTRLRDLRAEKFAADQSIAKEAAAKEREEAASKAAKERARIESAIVQQADELAASYPDFDSLTAHLGGAEPTPAAQRLLDRYVREPDDKLRAEKKAQDYKDAQEAEAERNRQEVIEREKAETDFNRRKETESALLNTIPHLQAELADVARLTGQSGRVSNSGSCLKCGEWTKLDSFDGTPFHLHNSSSRCSDPTLKGLEKYLRRKAS